VSFQPKRVGRLLAVGLLAGLVAGLIAGGAGSRVAMRIVALAAGHEHYGEITDAEATVGEISAGGTVFLLFAGAFFGMLGGLGYVVVRRLLPGSTLVKGLAFGLLLLVVTGSLVIDGDNPDFTRFTSPYLAVGLFAALFILFGVLVAVLVARFAGSAVARPRRSVRISGGAALGGLTIYSLVLDVEALSAIF
jgi:hypothetical protein